MMALKCPEAKLVMAKQIPLPRSVRRAVEAMRAQPGRAFTLSKLVNIAGVSRRTLQRQFKAFLCKTPQEVLRDIRFERARRDLLCASPTATVTDIALRYGLVHLGRFSVEYHKRYREKPSATLHRRATFLAGQSTKSSLVGVHAHDHPTIAVTTEGRDSHETLARSIVDELAIALMRAGIAVTNRPEMARYHLRCTLREVGRAIRLTSRLVDAATGSHLWAHCHDGTTEDAFEFEENAAAIIAVAMRRGLRAAEVERARRKPHVDQTAHDLTMRALPHALALDVDGNRRSLDLLDQAMERDPDHTLAIALAAWCHGQGLVYQFSDNPGQARAQALSFAQRAISIGGDPTALPILGNAFALAGDVQAAESVTRKALALDGQFALGVDAKWLDRCLQTTISVSRGAALDCARSRARRSAGI